MCLLKRIALRTPAVEQPGLLREAFSFSTEGVSQKGGEPFVWEFKINLSELEKEFQLPS